MRNFALFAALLAVTGCAQPSEHPRDAHDVVAVSDTANTVVLTDTAPAPIVSESGGHARLSRVVTLGQASTAAAYDDPKAAPAPRAPAQGPGGGTTVIVNNNVGGGGYGGYYTTYGGGGYGAGGRGGYARGSESTPSRTGYAPTGWEGAGRTAGQGQTPHVGGNWPTAPSFGPRAAR